MNKGPKHTHTHAEREGLKLSKKEAPKVLKAKKHADTHYTILMETHKEQDRDGLGPHNLVGLCVCVRRSVCLCDEECVCVCVCDEECLFFCLRSPQRRGNTWRGREEEPPCTCRHRVAVCCA